MDKVIKYNSLETANFKCKYWVGSASCSFTHPFNSLKFNLLDNKNNIPYLYKEFLGVLIPPFVKWNWSAVMPQSFIRSAYSCYLLTMLVPLNIKNNIYLHLIRNIIFITINNRKGEK